MRDARTIYWLVIAAAALAVAFAPLPFVTFPIRTESRTYHIQASQFAYSPANCA